MKKSVVTVQNAEGEPETTAEILVQNKIDYVPKVSVVIPVYNVEKYLRECLDSVVGQTLREIEIICVDDGSTDSSLEILKEYAAKDERISVLRQENLHAGVARNAGLTVAKGEYLSFLDSDDFFELNMLEEMYQKAVDNQADICVCEADRYDKDGVFSSNYSGIHKQYLPTHDVFTPEEIKEHVFSFTNSASWNKLYLNNLIKKNNIKYQNFTSCNDIGFVFSALSMSSQITIIEKNFVHYRQSENSITSKRGSKAVNILYVYVFLREYLQKHDRSCYLPALDRQIRINFLYELDYCSDTDRLNFQNQAKKLLGSSLKKFSDIFCDTARTSYKLFGFIPLLKIEEK